MFLYLASCRSSSGGAQAGTGAGAGAPHAEQQQQQQQQPAPAPPKPRQIASYCRGCGGPVELAIPDGDDHWRHVCQSCGAVEFYNPKTVRPSPLRPPATQLSARVVLNEMWDAVQRQ